jgi:hypothetical protein
MKQETVEGNLACGRHKAKALLAEREQQAKRQRCLEEVACEFKQKNLLLEQQQKLMLDHQKMQVAMMMDPTDPRRVAFMEAKITEFFPEK